MPTSRTVTTLEALTTLEKLRKLARSFHAKTSGALGTSDTNLAESLQVVESKLGLLRENYLKNIAFKPPQRKAMASLFKVLGSEKLEREDRRWELAISKEAIIQGWRFWKLEAQPKIMEVEAWDKRLSEILWPNGIVLFVEASSEASVIEKKLKSRKVSRTWAGAWTIVLHPELNPLGSSKQWPREWYARFKKLTDKNHCRWKLLFPFT